MTLSGSAAVVLVAAVGIGVCLSFSQPAPNEPTQQEIADAYRSKSGEGGMLVPGLHWERWRIREIRGWKLRFKRISQRQSPGVMTFKYGAVAKKNGSCADYQISDTMPFPPVNPQMKPILVVEPAGVRACR